MSLAPFLYSQPIDHQHLPLTLMTLDDWALVRITGQDSEKYLQSQLTVDVVQMQEHQHLIAAHCTPTGKMLSNLHLFRCTNGFAFITRRNLCESQLNEMKKYAVFSNVFFTIDDDIVLLGVAGLNARKALTDLFKELPTIEKQVIHDYTTVLLWFKYPSERFLLATNVITARYIIKALDGKAKFNNSQQWLSLNIEAGIPIIDKDNSGRFIPQATNMQELGGINFKKGCYIGQEMIMRATFRGTNKRSMLCLTGTGKYLPIACENIEKKINNQWRNAGIVLAAVRLSNRRLLVQAVINNHTDLSCLFRIRNNHDILCINNLPYIKKL